MMDFNTIVITGRLVADPVHEMTAGGTAVMRCRIASDQIGRDREAMFVSIRAFGKAAESLATIGAAKGQQVLIDGRLEMNTWETRDGQKRQDYTIICQSVTILSGRREQ